MVYVIPGESMAMDQVNKKKQPRSLLIFFFFYCRKLADFLPSRRKLKELVIHVLNEKVSKLSVA